MALSLTGYSASVRLPFSLWHRIGLAALIAFVSYVGWLASWSLASVTFAMAAILGDRTSQTILDSSLYRFGAAWQWVMAACAGMLIVIVVGKRRLATAAASAWLISVVTLSVLGAVVFGFSWIDVPAPLVALFLAGYTAFGARAA